MKHTGYHHNSLVTTSVIRSVELKKAKQTLENVLSVYFQWRGVLMRSCYYCGRCSCKLLFSASIKYGVVELGGIFKKLEAAHKTWYMTALPHAERAKVFLPFKQLLLGRICFNCISEKCSCEPNVFQLIFKPLFVSFWYKMLCIWNSLLLLLFLNIQQHLRSETETNVSSALSTEVEILLQWQQKTICKIMSNLSSSSSSYSCSNIKLMVFLSFCRMPETLSLWGYSRMPASQPKVMRQNPLLGEDFWWCFDRETMWGRHVTYVSWDSDKPEASSHSCYLYKQVKIYPFWP